MERRNNSGGVEKDANKRHGKKKQQWYRLAYSMRSLPVCHPATYERPHSSANGTCKFGTQSLAVL
jgi:hypothetical protein